MVKLRTPMIYQGDTEFRSITMQLPRAEFERIDRMAHDLGLPRSGLARILFRRLLGHSDWIAALMNEGGIDQEPQPTKHPRPRVLHPLPGD